VRVPFRQTVPGVLGPPPGGLDKKPVTELFQRGRSHLEALYRQLEQRGIVGARKKHLLARHRRAAAADIHLP